MIAEKVTIHVFDEKNWVINTPKGRNLLINQHVYKLYELLKKSKNEQNALIEFNTTLNLSQFRSLIFEKLGGYNILDEDSIIEKPLLKNQYLKLKVQLINSHLAGLLSLPFQPFFKPKLFWYSLIICLLSIIFIWFISGSNSLTQGIDYSMLIFLFYATMIIHELGHIGACAKYGLKHGGIGFGFYFILPVMYADITNIWLASKKQRIIANLAGIFTEIFYATILGIIYLITENNTFLVASVGITTFVVWEFNPFVRFDGYWVLSDITGVPNLLTKANKKFWECIQFSSVRLFLKSPLLILKNSSYKDQLLFIYGMLNTIFLIAIMSYTLWVHWVIVRDFPIIVLDLAQKAVSWKMSWNLVIERGGKNLLIVLTFYILAARWVWSQSQLLIQKSKNVKNIYFASGK